MKEDFVKEMLLKTKQLTLRSIKIFQSLPKTEESKIIGKQFLRSSTSVGANYRAVCRARSRAEYFSKLSITIEETDETMFWIEIMIESGIMTKEKLDKLYKDYETVIKILATARKNTQK